MFQSSVAPEDDRNATPANITGRYYAFQSSVAPEDDRNKAWLAGRELGFDVPILGRPGGRPQQFWATLLSGC